MSELVLQKSLPYPVNANPRLPGVAPLDPAEWLVFDEAEAGQFALKARLISDRREAVLAQTPGSEAAQEEALATVLAHLKRDHGRTPQVSGAPLEALSRIVQEDIVIMEKRGAEHVLTAALLCFPASWTLAEKIGRPMVRIHKPVAEYDTNVATRVQRLFDGVKVGRPLWRYNALWYHDPALYQPRREDAQRVKPPMGQAGYFRSERQVMTRLPQTGAVVFSIHTYVVARADVQPGAVPEDLVV